MYRILNNDRYQQMPSFLFCLYRRHLACDLCCPCLHQRYSFSTSLSQSIQYQSALKHLLRKKSKKLTKKHYVEVLQGTETRFKNIRASVDVVRGKQLMALTSQLTMMNKTSLSSHNSNFSTSILQSTESLSRYDPILIVPVANSNSLTMGIMNINNLEKVDHKWELDARTPLSENKLSPVNLSLLPNNYIQNSNRALITEDLPHLVNNSNVNIQNLENIMDTSPEPIHKIEHIQGSLKKKLSSRSNYRERKKIISTVSKDEVIKGVAESTDYKKQDDKVVSKTYSKKKTREAIAQQKMSDLNRKKKQESLNMNFMSFVDVCVHSGLVNDAFIAVKVYRRKCVESMASNAKITDIEVYNKIMSGYAKTGNWVKIRKLMGYAEIDQIQFNAQTYAAILECLGYRRDCELIKSQLEDMNKINIPLDDVLTTTKLSATSYENVLNAIKLVMPNFEPRVPPINLSYDCVLLNHLNDEGCRLSPQVPSHLNTNYIKSLYDQQIKIENENYVKIKTVEKRPTSDSESLLFYRKKLSESQDKWRVTVEEAFDRELDLLRQQSNHKNIFYLTILPYLVSIPKEEHVDIIMHEIRKLAEGSETYSPSTLMLYRLMGTQVFLRYQMKKKLDSGALAQLNRLYQEFAGWYINPDESAANSRQKWQRLLHENSVTHNLCSNDPTWKSNVLIGVGRFLYNIIIRDIKIDANVMRMNSKKEHLLPAFYLLFRTKEHASKEQVKPHPTLSRLFRAAAPEYLEFEASKIPMVCPSLPWTSISSGGYLLTKTDFIRLPYQAVAQWNELERTPIPKLFPAFDSLNQLAAVPWAVNEQVLDVVLEVFKSGGSEELDVPQPATACPAAPTITPDMLPQERGQIFRQRLVLRRKKAEMYSLWCDALYKLSLADHFRKKHFWLPHNMDFRGRVYPVAPHLNHLGSDLSRSLLVFAKGQPLGEEGLNWLKIHTINLTGTHKKKSMQERLEYADAILDDIIDSADRPLTGRMWWKESEEPWQTLAACMEVRNAVASGDAASYVSHFPVHQDGSCNGLQHYAALGRDRVGGESVNLTPAAVPQDVYSCVAVLVERERCKDAANGVPIAQHLEGFIQRKVIKQTVMTTVYGVTRFGARLQIARQLKDLNKFPKQYVWPASLYLVNKTFDSLQEMFTSTKEIQDWFTECARLIAQVCGENVQWVTPLGLPIVQPYSKSSAIVNPSNFKFIGTQASSTCDAFDRPNVMKQKNAFAPNFVHSLDSSHMMLTSIMSERLGITFVSVHDCYWTHACSVPAMNRVCRSQFVALHEHPVLLNLSKYFEERFAYSEENFANDGSVTDLSKRSLNRILRQLPSTGQLDLKEVLNSPYFFS